MLAGVVVGGLLRSVPLVAIALIGGIVTALVIVLLNVSFGRDNPAAALLEGAEFLEFHQMQMTAVKGSVAIVLPSGAPVEEPPKLTGKDTLDSLPESTEPTP